MNSEVSSREPASEEEIQELTKLGELLIRSILEQQSFEIINDIVGSGAPLWYQDAVEGISALHAAAYTENAALIKALIQKGAVWNAVDYMGNTAGDIALSLNNTECYIHIRDAGLRSELLLGRLASRMEEPMGLILREEDYSAAGFTEVFMDSRLRFSEDENGQAICTVQANGVEIGVMMGWERGIMKETVEKLCTDHEKSFGDLKILNIGFGLGIIDSLFQALPAPPAHHVIIEPHPDVLQHMKKEGWYNKPGVTILEGKWQDFVNSEELLGTGGFDVVYTDTFSENYKDLRQFFDHVPNLLVGPDSRFSFFNGLGATNALFYDVYTHVSEMDLADVGLDVQWSEVDVGMKDDLDRWASSRQYFTQPYYRLPLAVMRVTI